RASGDGRRLRLDRRPGRAAEEGDQDLPDDDARSGGSAGLAARAWGDAGRYGEHRRLLAPGLRRVGRAFDLIVGNARHIRNVPGRKTDVKDAEWIADLVRHGLIAKSFVP